MAMAHTAILFNRLKPICGSIIENPTIEQLCKLKEFIATHDEYIIQSAFEYTVFPLYIHLEKENSYKNDIKQEIIDTLKCLLEVATIKNIQFIFRLCTALTKQIVDGRTSTIIQSTDEELKLSVINCLVVLFNRLTPTIVSELYNRNNVVHFSQTFYLCVQILNLEKMRDLKLAAIKCLMTMCYVHNEADDTDIVLRKQVADATMFFLPGVSIALRNTAIADEKQGHKITFLAIRALTRIIVIQMTEYEPPDDAEILIEFPSKEIKPKPVEVRPKNVEAMKQIVNCETKTKDWCTKTSDNLKIIIGSLVPLTWHAHELVRFELSDLCDQILRRCSKSLECCLGFCIEVLISLSEDEYAFVAEKSKVALVDLLAHADISIFDVLCENFYAVITRLPRILTTAGKEEQLSALSLLVGYIKILGQTHLCKILQSPDQLGRLMEFLVFASQMEDTHATLFEDHSIRDFESFTTTHQHWKQFKLIHEEKHLTKIQTALHFLATSNALDILIDYLCDMFMNEFDQRNAVVFLLNEILSVTLNNKQNHILIVSDVMKMYMNETDWYLPTDVDYLTISEIHFNIIQMCLLVEGLGNMALGIGVHYKQFLFKTLYIILERAGSGHPLLSAAGLAAIVNISKACNYNSVTDLIVQNTDYFSFHVVKRLKKLDQDVNVLNVLNVVMKHSKIDVLPSIMEIIDDVLLHSFDKFQTRNLTSFLEVFYSFITNLKRWLNTNILKDNRYIQLLNEYKRNMDFFYAMYGNFDDYNDEMIGKSTEELFEEDMKEKQEIEDEYHEEDDDDKKVPPANIKLIVKVLKRSLHFLPSKNLERKLLVLNILREGLVLLSAWENELLPLVHQIWSPLVDRLQSTEEPLEINQSFELLLVLAKLSKDFIRNRTSKEVFPEICKTLKNTSEQSYLKDRGAAYRYTQNYKLQLNILNNFAQLITDLEMSFDDVSLAVVAVAPYLSDRQPIPLQESAIQFFKTLACFDFEAVWAYLIECWGLESKPVTNAFRKNTEILLKSLEVIHW